MEIIRQVQCGRRTAHTCTHFNQYANDYKYPDYHRDCDEYQNLNSFTDKNSNFDSHYYANPNNFTYVHAQQNSKTHRYTLANFNAYTNALKIY